MPQSAAPSSSSSSSYVIVGAGVFGTSTAYHLIQKYPNASITLIDRDAVNAPTRVAASWDWNKVVRADYADPDYCRLALEAKKVWANDPLWAPFYHQSGIYWISPSDSGFAAKVLQNYERLGEKGELDCVMVEVDEARNGELYEGLFKDADYTGVKEVLINRSSGWADAKGVLRRVGERCVELGVKYLVNEVEGLEIAEDGTCTGVKIKGGEVLYGDKVVLCTGSFTPKLLADSAMACGRNELMAGGRMISAGVTTGLAQLDDDSAKRFANMPVCIQEVPTARGANNGGLPLTGDNQLKFWGQQIFSNTTEHPSGIPLSTPPLRPDYAQWDVPESLKDDIRLANKFIFGYEGRKLELNQFRICWEATTPSEDFIISPHSASKGLYVATCGSFHGWKFFPITGKYVVQMLEGLLEPDLEKKWAWDREIPNPERSVEWPQKELRDLVAG